MDQDTPDLRERGELTCFVIGPIGDKLAEFDSPGRRAYEQAIEILEAVIEPACQAFGIRVMRSDTIATAGEIPEQIFRHLRDDYLVVADLTDANPNVMYELGLRHTTGKLTIQIGEKSRLPFDVSTIRTIMFTRTESGLINARRQLSSAISAGLESGGDPVTAARVWFERGPRIELAHAEGDQDDAPGYLELLDDMEEGMHSTLTSLNAFPEVMSTISEMVREATNDMETIVGTDTASSAKIYITNRLANRLAEPVSRFEVLAGEYKQSVARMHPGVLFLLEDVAPLSESPEVSEFKASICMMYEQAIDSFDSLRAFRESAKRTGEATREFRKVTKRIVKCLDEILSTESTLSRWSELANCSA